MTEVMENRALKRVTLEMSLKPFKSMEHAAVEQVCTEAIRQWLPLIGMAESCSMLLWVADGSEVLTWDGNFRRELEWGRYIGYANEQFFSQIQDKNDPRIAMPYIADPPRITYDDLRFIVSAFKRIAADQFDIRMEVGATVDAGPEFAYSDFKYKLHPEINQAEIGGQYVSLKSDYHVICSWSKLKADSIPYAAYPEGIPEDTPFGEFLGKQCASFLPALGFDYIWFSNGFALSCFPWTYLGANFDGKVLPLADYNEISNKILSFWDLFKQACPDYRTEIRGTNFGTGMDLAKDYISLLDLYERKYVDFPPPNSPWGALNFDFGLEMTGYMSRIAILPGTTYPFRFYANDPWFWQNPWWDLYDREPHDIYCPLSVARVNALGKLENPGIIEILTIDTEKGELIADCAMEIIPHLRKAVKDFPNQPGILTWLYPFREYHHAVAESAENSRTVFFDDWFVRNAINQGLPLNTVLSTDDFFAMSDDVLRKLQDTILLTPTSWLTGDKAQSLIKYIENGGKVLLYGAVIDSALSEFLNLRQEIGLEGDLTAKISIAEDILSVDPKQHEKSGDHRKVRHESMISSGAICEVLHDPTDIDTQIRMTVNQDDQERIFALTKVKSDWKEGRVSWVRGSLPFQIGEVTNLPIRQEEHWMDTSVLARYLLADFGFSLLQKKHEDSTCAALFFVTRHDNAFLFTGCKQDTSVSFQLRFPEGVPIIIGQTTLVGEEAVTYSLDRTFHDESRVFIKQKEPKAVSCREFHPYPSHLKSTVRCISVTNLLAEEVTIYPPLKALQAGIVEVKNGETFIDLSGKVFGDRIRLTNIRGTIDISW
mgnify:CR=1 FL=1